MRLYAYRNLISLKTCVWGRQCVQKNFWHDLKCWGGADAREKYFASRKFYMVARITSCCDSFAFSGPWRRDSKTFLLGPQSCSIGFIFGLFWHLAVIFFPSLKIECFKLSANLGTCKWFIIWMALMQVVEKSEDNSFWSHFFRRTWRTQNWAIVLWTSAFPAQQSPTIH